jgi:Zn-dependent peptidase ImmA (M78 family)
MTKGQLWWREERLPQIEGLAYTELTKYEESFGALDTPMIPIDKIIESWGLAYYWDDLRNYGAPEGTIGLLDHQKKLIVLEETIREQVRERFTLAHEAGHWKLHLKERPAPNQLPLFQDAEEWFFCRGEAEEPWMFQEANHFAACILMPRDRLVPLAQELLAGAATDALLDGRSAAKVLSDLAGTFGVSRLAMEIRLEELGLISQASGGMYSLDYLDDGLLFRSSPGRV